MVLYGESMSRRNSDTKSESETKAQSEPEKLIIEYNNRTWKSWVNLGIEDIVDKIPHNVQAPETRKREFLSRVDLEQGPIERKVTTMVRLKAKDYNTKNHEPKEYLVYYDSWYAKDWMGRKLIVGENIESVYMEQEKEKIIKYNEKSGPEIVGYRRSGEHEVHYVEFSKDAVDKIIGHQDKGDITFVVKIPPRRDHFTYDEFVNYSWEQLNDILLTVGGAEAARADRIMSQGSKVKTANNLGFKPS